MTPAERVPAESIETAHDSYMRCSADAFYSAFYRRLLASDPAIEPMFAKTDFMRQNKLLQHALGLLLAYGRPGNGNILDRIAERHERTDLNVPPSMYPHFTESLIETVREFDPRFTPAIEQAWRRSLAPGLDYMASFYEKGHA